MYDVKNLVAEMAYKEYVYQYVFNVRCDIDKLIPSIKKIKYNLKIVKDNPMILKKFY